MSGYPNAPYGYGAPPNAYPYGAPPAQPKTSPPFAAPPPHHYPPAPYGAPPQVAQPYGAPTVSNPYGVPYAAFPGEKPAKEKPMSLDGGHPHMTAYPPSAPAYGSPFASLMPSSFPPGTDTNIVACFQLADQDGSGCIDDKEMQRALSSYNQSFSLRSVHLLMYLFTNSNARKMGPQEFTAIFYSLQNWRSIFERFDRDRSGKIDPSELKEALLSLSLVVSPVVLELLVSKFDKSGGKNNAIEYDNFIECCLTVKGLTEKFKEKDSMCSGSATFNFENFMLTVLPFLIA